LARRAPGKVTIAITGLGSVSHLGVELFQAAAGVQFLQVPYRGAAPALSDLIGERIDGLFGDGPTVLGHIAAGRLRPLAAPSTKGSEICPEVPTFVEQGFPDIVADQWAGILVPARTPADVVARLNAGLVAALGDAELRARFVQTGTVPSPDTPRQFGQY